MKSSLSNDDLRTIIEHMLDGIWIADQNGTAVYANSSALTMFGCTEDEIIGRTAEELVDMGLSTFPTAWKTAQEKRPIFKMITTRLGKNVEQISTPIFDDDGNLWRVIISSRYYSKSFERSSNADTVIPTAEEMEENSRMATPVEQEITYIASSSKMSELLETAKRAAKSDATVMIYGESGSGKDGLAGLIHANSNRHLHPFVVINCATIPHNLIESELFGYEKGAFTDAVRTRIGLFEQANHGTIFLDEVGDLPLSAQVKLLRCIQNREILRLGGKDPIKLDVRFITATNKNLEQLVEKGEFREDLYYRLNIIKLVVPPLREHRNDIPALADFFLMKFNKKYKAGKRFSPDVAALLKKYDYPGNIRELENAIECAVVLCPYVIISCDYLPERIRQHSLHHKQVQTLREARQEFEEKYIRDVLDSGYTFREAAEILGVDHSTLVRKLKKKTEDNL
ncbi:MAG: sigma-54 interaction domain-containing protein [Mailhella sp.]